MHTPTIHINIHTYTDACTVHTQTHTHQGQGPDYVGFCGLVLFLAQWEVLRFEVGSVMIRDSSSDGLDVRMRNRTGHGESPNFYHD